MMISASRRNFLKASSAFGVASVMPGTLSAASAFVEEQIQMPTWRSGILDIHHISTGRGSCAFLMCPDGTTMMIDAGSIITHLEPGRDKYIIDPLPNGTLRPGQWIANYVQPLLAQAGRSELDYFLLTHFHADHMGEIAPGKEALSPMSKLGPYQLGGLTDVAERIPIRTVIDRNFPGYDYPVPHNGPQDLNYHAFGRSFLRRGGRIEKLTPGINSQLTLQHDPKRYPAFAVRNLAANGEVWTGSVTHTIHLFPALETLAVTDYPSENKCSLAVRLDYGPFKYFSAGDMDWETSYGRLPWGDIESAVARASGPVDIAVADHHGFANACGPEWVRALQAQTYVINAWDSAHPTISALANIFSTELYTKPRMVFSTAMKPDNVIATRGIADLTSNQGHVIFRVANGGTTYEIFVKDSSMQNGKLLSRYGPFVSGA